MATSGGRRSRSTSRLRGEMPQQWAVPPVVAPRFELRGWLHQRARAQAEAGVADPTAYADGAIADAARQEAFG
eukprot:11213867-Lingulodinium_polyedra.AAC.1